MKTVGVIVEYNPFHNGHLYHLNEARRRSQADIVIAVLNGNFTQRGTPAIVDKWTRCQMALTNGADLVIELPFCYGTSSADYFAEGAVRLLFGLGCDALCFGTDNDMLNYQAFGKLALKHQGLINQRLKELPNNLNYPAKMTQIWREILKDETISFNTPNHLLALSYAKANASLAAPMKLIPINRYGAQFHQLGRSGRFASATAIRQMILSNQTAELAEVVPKVALDLLMNAAKVQTDTLYPLLKYRILTSSVMQLRQIHQMKEGLEHKLKREINQAETFDTLLERLKSKRYTHAFLRRLLIYLLLNVTDDEMTAQRAHLSLRLLGFSAAGQRYLKENKQKFRLPILSRVGQSTADIALNLKADAVYQLLNSAISEQNYGRVPQIYDKKE